MNPPTTGISKFLDQLLRPLFDKHVRSMTIIDGVDLIRRLETYVENDFLKPTTQLCTFDISDLYTMLPLVYCVIDFFDHDHDHDHGEKKFINHDHELLFQLVSRSRQSRSRQSRSRQSR
jgi:hypothetical protein